MDPAYSNAYAVESEAPVWVSLLVGLIGCVGALIALAIAVWVFYTLYTVQKAVPQEHRKIEPPMVFLLLIPLFNLVWNFFVFLRVPESYQSYFAAIGRPGVGEPERKLGLIFSILAAVCVIPFVNLLAGPAALIVLVMFLVKMSALRRELESTRGAAGA